MLEKDLKNILDVLTLMKEFERTIAELYRTCSMIWLEDEGFWTDTERAEIKHVQHIDKMMKIILERPEDFKPGHPFKPAAIQTSLSGIKENIQRLKRGEMNRDRMLFIARDIEQSMLESKYFEIIKTDDIHIQSLIHEMLTDTAAHHERLNKKIKGKE